MSHAFDSRVRRSLTLAAVSIIAAMVIGCALVAATVHSYTVSMFVESAFAIWNDEALAVFVPRRTFGSSATILQRLASPVARWAGARSVLPTEVLTTDAMILCVENGVLTTSRRAPWSPPSPRPRFVNGRLLIFGGAWNGSQIDTVDPKEYLRLMRSSQADEAGGWHSAFLFEGGVVDVPVRIHGDALTLRGTTSADGVTIDLVGGAGSPMRLIDVRFGPRAVSAREFASTFSGAHSVSGPTFVP